MFLSKLFVPIASRLSRAASSSCNPICKQPIRVVVTIYDVSCPFGQNLALLLKQNPDINELRLYSKDDKACGIAMDISAIDTFTKVRAFAGCCLLKEAIEGATIVILAGGVKKKACQLQAHLFKQNVDETRKLALYLAEFNPSAIFCIARYPINSLVPMVSAEYIKAEVYDSRKIIGVTALETMRANYFFAKHQKLDPADVIVPVIGGGCPRTIVPVFSQAKPPSELNGDTYEKIVHAIGYASDDILKIKEKEKSGFICYAPAMAVSRFIDSVVKAVRGQKNCVECAYVRQTGHICKFLPYMTSIVRLGPEGVKSCHMPALNQAETRWLKCAHKYIQMGIALGERIASGGRSVWKQKKCLQRSLKCDIIDEEKTDDLFQENKDKIGKDKDKSDKNKDKNQKINDKKQDEKGKENKKEKNTIEKDVKEPAEKARATQK